jgi:hypothetical protein
VRQVSAIMRWIIQADRWRGLDSADRSMREVCGQQTRGLGGWVAVSPGFGVSVGANSGSMIVSVHEA